MSLDVDLTLDNGLRVFIQESRAAPVVAVQVWINAGSADETPEEAGVAHLLEHMMFKGTDTRPVGAITQEIEGAGGEINAFTSFDQTCYHLTLASRHAGLGLDILSDVIQHSVIDADELALEKEVVLEEVRRSADTPARRLDESVFRTVYRRHPYGRPIIGYVETVKGFTREDVRRFYERWYTPENMAVVVVGDVQADDIEAKVRSLFEGFSRPAPPPKKRHPEGVQSEPRFVYLPQSVQEGRLEIAFPAPRATHPDAPLLDLLSLILGQGKSSRLTENVRNQKQLVNSVYAYAYTPRDPGIFLVGAGFEPTRFMDVYEALLEELHQIISEPVRGSELRKARSIIQSTRVYERETVEERAHKFGYYLVSYGGFDQEKAYYRRIEEAGTEDLLRVAQEWIRPERLTLGVMLPRDAQEPRADECLDLARARLSHSADRAPALVRARRERDTMRLVLPNGIRLLVRENHSVPLVSLRAAFEGGQRYENARTSGVFQAIGRMLTRGTERHRAAQIAHEVESLAGDIGGFAGRNAFGLRGDFLSEHLERGVELFAEILTTPSFEPHELDKVRRHSLESLRNQKDHASGYVFHLFEQTFFRRHPFRMHALGSERSLGAMTSRMLRNTFRRYATPGNMVLAVVGDVDARDMEHLATRYFGELPAGDTDFPEVKVEPPLTKRRTRMERGDKEQLHLLFGWPGVGLEHPDRYAMQVMSSVLSGQSGRLFMELRDKQGLAYSVSSMNMQALGIGYFAVYIGTDPSKYARARDGILGELKRLLDEGITEEELRRAQRYLVGSYEIDLQRFSALCSNLAFNELYGLGHDAFRRYPERINAVGIDDVLDVARRYLDLDVYVMAGYGPTDVEGARTADDALHTESGEAE